MQKILFLFLFFSFCAFIKADSNFPATEEFYTLSSTDQIASFFFREISKRVVTAQSDIPYCYRYILNEDFSHFVLSLYQKALHTTNIYNPSQLAGFSFGTVSLLSRLFPDLKDTFVAFARLQEAQNAPPPPQKQEITTQEWLLDTDAQEKQDQEGTSLPETEQQEQPKAKEAQVIYKLSHGVIRVLDFADETDAFYFDAKGSQVHIIKDNQKIIKNIYDTSLRLLQSTKYENSNNIQSIKLVQMSIYEYPTLNLSNLPNLKEGSATNTKVFDSRPPISMLQKDYNLMTQTLTLFNSDCLATSQITKVLPPQKQDSPETQEENTQNIDKDIPFNDTDDNIAKEQEKETKQNKNKQLLGLDPVAQEAKGYGYNYEPDEDFENDFYSPSFKDTQLKDTQENLLLDENNTQISQKVTDNTDGAGDTDDLLEEKSWGYDTQKRITELQQTIYSKKPHPRYTDKIITTKTQKKWLYTYTEHSQQPDYKYFEDGKIREELIYQDEDSYTKTLFFDKGFVAKTIVQNGQVVLQEVKQTTKM